MTSSVDKQIPRLEIYRWDCFVRARTFTIQTGSLGRCLWEITNIYASCLLSVYVYGWDGSSYWWITLPSGVLAEDIRNQLLVFYKSRRGSSRSSVLVSTASCGEMLSKNFILLCLLLSTVEVQTVSILKALQGFHVAHDDVSDFAMNSIETLKEGIKEIKELGGVVPEFIISLGRDFRPVLRLKLKTRWLPIVPAVNKTDNTEEQSQTDDSIDDTTTTQEPILHRIKSAHRQHYVKALQKHLKSLHLVAHPLSSNWNVHMFNMIKLKSLCIERFWHRMSRL